MRIISPMDGIVEKKMVEAGELVKPGDGIARIIDIRRIKVQAAIAEKDVNFISRESSAEIVFDAYRDRILTGRVDYIAAAADPSNGTFRIEIPLENKKGLIRPGMFARILLLKKRCESCLLVPQDSLIENAEGTSLFIIDDERTARRRTVTPGDSEGSRVVIEEGLKEGERLVIVGQRNLADSDRVQVVE